jgi:hypothetical protein
VIKLTDGIFLFTDLFEDLDKIFLNLSQCNWEIWGRDNNDPSNRIGEYTVIRNNKDLSDTIILSSQKCLDEYMNELNINKELYYHDTTSIYVKKWDFPMIGMNAHRDHTYDIDGNPKEVEYTICGYLNDNYEGGLIEFPEHNISLRPPAGSLIVFPSHELHQVTNVIDGHRYMWSSFVYKK